MPVLDASRVEEVAGPCDFVFCAVDMKKDEIRALEEAYAKTETPVVSNNSANRGVPDVPMIIPEINPSTPTPSSASGSAWAPRSLHRRQAQLLHPVLRPGAGAAVLLRHRERDGLDLPGHLRRGQDL